MSLDQIWKLPQFDRLQFKDGGKERWELSTHIW